MFERYTQTARRIIVMSKDEAVDLGHTEIGTQHLLAALTRDQDGFAPAAAQMLEALAITHEKVIAGIKELVGVGHDRSEPPLAFSWRVKDVLKLSLGEAAELGHNDVDTYHLLLGLIRHGEGIAAQIITGKWCGVTLGRLRSEIMIRLPTLNCFHVPGVGWVEVKPQHRDAVAHFLEAQNDGPTLSPESSAALADLLRTAFPNLVPAPTS